MPHAEQTFHALGASIPQAVASQMFGKLCYKVNGKAFVCFFQNCMVFKLTSPDHAEALALPGAILFDPSGRGRAMKEWVQLPYDTHAVWQRLAQSARAYVAGEA